jgi:hypothetical protein
MATVIIDEGHGDRVAFDKWKSLGIAESINRPESRNPP